MKKTSLTRALFVAGVMAVAGAAQADAIFYPDGSSVDLGANAAESGMIDRVLAQSPSSAPSSVQLASMGISGGTSPASLDVAVLSDDEGSVDTTALGAGPANMSTGQVSTTTTTVTSAPVYVFPNINWDRSTVQSLRSHSPMLSGIHPSEHRAASTFDSPTRAGEASTMTSGAPNLVTDNERVGVETAVVPPPVIAAPNTTELGAGSSSLQCPAGSTCTYIGD